MRKLRSREGKFMPCDPGRNPDSTSPKFVCECRGSRLEGHTCRLGAEVRRVKSREDELSRGIYHGG